MSKDLCDVQHLSLCPAVMPSPKYGKLSLVVHGKVQHFRNSHPMPGHMKGMSLYWFAHTLSSTSDRKRALGGTLQNLNAANRSADFSH
jgi:hypothetical protein